MNRAGIASLMTILNLFNLNNAKADSLFHALCTTDAHDTKTIENLKQNSDDAAARIKALNEFSAKDKTRTNKTTLPTKGSASDKSQDKLANDDDDAEVPPAQTAGKAPKSLPKYKSKKSADPAPEKVQSLNTDNIPDEIILEVEATPTPAPHPKKK